MKKIVLLSALQLIVFIAFARPTPEQRIQDSYRLMKKINNTPTQTSFQGSATYNKATGNLSKFY